MAAGDFSATVLQDINLRVQEEWPNSQWARSQVTTADAAKAVIANSTAKLLPLADKNKKYTVKLTWVNACSMAVDDCESNCTLTETEASTGSKEYELTQCFKTGFSVNETTLEDNQYNLQEVVTPLMVKALATMDQEVSKRTLLALKTFAGINVAPSPWNISGGSTHIPDAQYNMFGLWANLMFQAMRNKMGTPYFINNGDLYVSFQNALMNAGNLDAAGDVNRAKSLLQRWYFDFDGFAAANLTDSIFMVAPDAVYLATRAKNPDTPTEYRGTIQQTRYTVASPSLPGVKYDVFYALTCKDVNSGAAENIVHTWRIEWHGDVLLNPEGCPVTISGTTYNPTGVISYTHDAPVAG